MQIRGRLCSKHPLLRSLTVAMCGLPALASVGGSLSKAGAVDTADDDTTASTAVSALVAADARESSAAVLQVAAPQEINGWNFALKPYLWLAGIDADVQVGPLPEVSGDASFSEILEDLDFAFMMGVDAGPSDARWSLALDAVYMRITPKDDQVKVTQTMTMFDACVAFQVGQSPTLVELLGGVRGVDSSVDVDISGGGSDSGDKSWLEPLIGARCSVPLSDRIALRLRGDLSGFGVGSDLTWQLWGVFTYQFSEGFSAGLGYRHMEIDYSSDNFDLDMAMDGPILGLQFNI